MPKLIACLGMCLLFSALEFAAAQTPASRIEPTPNRYSNIRRPMTMQEHLIHQRAINRAVQREARLETRKWTGQSDLRPNVADGHYSNDLNGYIWAPRGGYYIMQPGW